MSLSNNGLLVCLLVTVIGGCLVYSLLGSIRGDRTLPYPPGPKARPIIGNLLDLPTKVPWEHAAKWGKEHGDIIHLSVGGIHLIFLNSYKRAIDLFEKRSAIYSDRVHTTTLELLNATHYLPALRYGPDFRLNRRIMHQEFNATSSLCYRDIHTRYARAMLGLMHHDPTAFREHINFFSGGLILEIVYGIQSESAHDPHIISAEKGVEVIQAGAAGTNLADAFPFLRHIPEWMPGAGFKRNARIWGNQALESYRIPFQMVLKSFEDGTAVPSFTTSWLSRISNRSSSDDEKERYIGALESVGGSAFLAGYETTTATLNNFILAMMLYSHVQHKAQQELDKVIGRGRLPEFSDKENLPYVVALYKEILRWRPTLPVGFPHRVIVDDEYEGMKIPKGAIILPNAWLMSQNEKEYGQDFDEFRPERFLNTSAQDPGKYVFGFGRRICLGRYVVEDSLFIAMCHILHTFRIEKPRNEDGTEKIVQPQWEQTLTAHLRPFPCSISLRFPEAEKLIHSTT